jgi:hypothetical protein
MIPHIGEHSVDDTHTLPLLQLSHTTHSHFAHILDKDCPLQTLRREEGLGKKGVRNWAPSSFPVVKKLPA